MKVILMEQTWATTTFLMEIELNILPRKRETIELYGTLYKVNQVSYKIDLVDDNEIRETILYIEKVAR